MIHGLLPLVALGVMLTATYTANAQTQSIFKATLAESDAKTAEVSTEQMHAIMLDGSAIIIDTRSRAEFDAGHLPQALSLDASPSAQVSAVESLVKGDRGKALVLYCNGPYCQASRRLAENLVAAGFSNVRRYQLGIPVWRSLGGPIEIEIGGVRRIFGIDKTAIYVDARPAGSFAKGSVPGAISAPVIDVLSGTLKKIDLPEDDFNRRIVIFGSDRTEARKLADFMGKRPWHNVSYFPDTYGSLISAIR